MRKKQLFESGKSGTKICQISAKKLLKHKIFQTIIADKKSLD
jgi:hypothetical protein